MAVVHKRGKIILTGNTAVGFSKKMKKPDVEIIRKRDAYFREIDKTLKISHNEKGNVVLQGK